MSENGRTANAEGARSDKGGEARVHGLPTPEIGAQNATERWTDAGRRVTERYGPVLASLAGSAGDWPEDFAHENGRYFCRCTECESRFIGHKRRVVCKVCATDRNRRMAEAQQEVHAMDDERACELERLRMALAEAQRGIRTLMRKRAVAKDRALRYRAEKRTLRQQVAEAQRGRDEAVRLLSGKPDVDATRVWPEEAQRLWEACIGLSDKADFKAFWQYVKKCEDRAKAAEAERNEWERLYAGAVQAAKERADERDAALALAERAEFALREIAQEEADADKEIARQRAAHAFADPYWMGLRAGLGIARRALSPEAHP